MRHREESARRVARWLADCFPNRFRRRRRPVVRRPDLAPRFRPLLESFESRESATLLSVSGIGLAATELALLNKLEGGAAAAHRPALTAGDELDHLTSTSRLAGSAGLSVPAQGGGGKPA